MAGPKQHYDGQRQGQTGQQRNHHQANWRDRADITTFYFTRFPEDASDKELWYHFKQMGDVREIFISKQRNKEGRRYGFVRYKGVSNASYMERKLDNIIVGGLKLHVNIPKYGRGKEIKEQNAAEHGWQKEGGNQRRSVAADPNTKRSYVEVVTSHTENKERRRRTSSLMAAHGRTHSSIILEISEEVKKRYADTWVGRLKRQQVFERVDDELSWILGSNVLPKYLRDDMVLRIGLSDTKAQELIREEINHGTSAFYGLEKWNSKTKPGNRLIWVQCWGIPLVAWSIDNLRKIVAAVGDLVEVDDDFEDMQRLDRARVLSWPTDTSPPSTTSKMHGDTTFRQSLAKTNGQSGTSTPLGIARSKRARGPSSALSHPGAENGKETYLEECHPTLPGAGYEEMESQPAGAAGLGMQKWKDNLQGLLASTEESQKGEVAVLDQGHMGESFQNHSNRPLGDSLNKSRDTNVNLIGPNLNMGPYKPTTPTNQQNARQKKPVSALLVYLRKKGCSKKWAQDRGKEINPKTLDFADNPINHKDSAVSCGSDEALVSPKQGQLQQSPSLSSSFNKKDMEDEDDVYRDLARELGVSFAENKSNAVKWSAIRKLTLANNIDILCIQETKKESVDVKLCQYLWSDNSVSWECVPSSNAAGGLLCIWNNGSFLVDRRVLGRGFIMLESTWIKENKRVFIINVYAPCELQGKREQWAELLQLKSSYQEGLWCVLGDFNSIRHREERLSSSQTVGTSSSISEFNSWISDMALEEVRSVGRKFTWCRPNGSAMSKLDRFLLSDEWLSQWPDSTQFVLERDFSDHCSILLKSRTID
ncbi:hypothetical protein JHK87_027555 [Glycine soja]|nr:hypothetical protein JHK87_027555 [Glycine soja]